jgi:hypothetical protein
VDLVPVLGDCVHALGKRYVKPLLLGTPLVTYLYSVSFLCFLVVDLAEEVDSVLVFFLSTNSTLDLESQTFGHSVMCGDIGNHRFLGGRHQLGF